MPANSAAPHIYPVGLDLSSSLSSSLALLQVSEKEVPSLLSKEASNSVKHWVAEQAEHMQVDADAAPTPPFTLSWANIVSPPTSSPQAPAPAHVNRATLKRPFDSALALYPPPPRQNDPPTLASTSVQTLTFHSLPLTMNLDKGHVLSLLDLCGVSEKEVIKVELRTIKAPRGSSAEKKPGATTATTATTRVDVEFEKPEVCAKVFERLAGATWKGEKLQVTREFKPSARGRTHLDTPSLHHDVDLAYDDEPPLRRRRHSLHPSLPPKPQVDVNSKVDSSPSDPSPRALLDYSDL